MTRTNLDFDSLYESISEEFPISPEVFRGHLNDLVTLEWWLIYYDNIKIIRIEEVCDFFLFLCAPIVLIMFPFFVDTIGN